MVSFTNDPEADSLDAFLTLDNVDEFFEMGLLGFAFHPNYQVNGEVFALYHDQDNNRRSTVSRYTRSGNIIDANSEDPILTLNQPAGNHNGGNMHFGPDGYLYFAFGDGGANMGESQDLETLHGAILRIDVDNQDAPLNYAIPDDNPFVDTPDAAPEIFAYGFRNPWRWSFDQETGDIWLGDVGESTIEEINVIESGNNYGWPIMEGSDCFDGGSCTPSNFALPRLEYNRIGTGHCSVTGGFVYRGDATPQLDGNYLYSDYCTGVVWRGFSDGGDWQSEQVVDAPFNVAAFGQGHDGEVYVLNISGGDGDGIYRLVETDNNSEPTVPELLSDTGCYSSTAAKTFADGVVPYDLNSALWSDGANKIRAFAIPDGSDISLDADGDFEFPPGSVLIKEFLDGSTYLETRLLMRHSNAWVGYSYEWLPDGSDANLLSEGKTVDTGNFIHTFPSPQQCDSCHTSAAGNTLGPEVAQLDRDFHYEASDVTSNQLDALDDAGYLADDPSAVDVDALAPLSDTNASLDARARSYLHSNCANCHRPNGPGSFMDLRAVTALADTGACNVNPSDDLDIADARIIAPGDADRSVLLARMRATDEHRMPPLASLIEDTEATDLIEDWIDALNSCSP